jgi:hypothetical protein
MPLWLQVSIAVLSLVMPGVWVFVTAHKAAKRDEENRAIAAKERQIERDKAWAVFEAKMVEQFATLKKEVGTINRRLDRIETRSSNGNGNGSGGAVLRVIAEGHDG